MFSSSVIIAAAAPKDMSVNVEIVEGSGLATKASTGKCDPYVTFTFRGAKKSTKVIPQTLAPVWKEQFTLGSFVAEDLIEVLCWDKDFPADPLGGFTIKLGDFMKPGEHTKSLPLEPRGKLEAKGKLTIKLYVNEVVSSTIVRKDSTLRRATVSSAVVEQEPENTDKAFVRRKLTGWLKLRPDKDKMEDKLRQMGVISGEASTKMFGASLDEVMSRQKESHPEIPVPIFLHQLIDKLLNDPSTFDEAGLFRISGSAAVTSKIKASVDAGQVPDLSPISRDDAASLLKEYIRQLPEPLFTWKLSDQWMAAADIEDETQLIATLRNLLRKLPGHNRHLWHAVNSFLYKLSQKSDVNKMTAENIGIVIGPNVLWERETRLPIMGMNYIVAHLVNHYTPIFHDWDTWLESQTSDPKLKTSVAQIGSAPVVLVSPRKQGKSLQDWTINDVTNWLNEKGYGQYSEAFTKQNLDGKALHKLTADDLLLSCGIQSLGHRKKIIFRRDELLKSS